MSRLVPVRGIHVKEPGGWLNISTDHEDVLHVARVPMRGSYVVVTRTDAVHVAPQNARPIAYD